MTFEHPDTFVVEKDQGTKPISGVSTAVGAFLGIAEKGPIGLPTKITSFEQFLRVFGNYLAGESLAYAVEGFFANGGQTAYVVRLGHYTDVADKSTLVAATASKTVNGPGSAAPARIVGNVAFTSMTVDDTDEITVEVDGDPGHTLTFVAKPTVLDGAVANFTNPIPADVTATYRINGGPVKSVSLPAGFAAAGVDAYAALLAARMEGVKVEVNAGAIRLTTDRKGTSASIEIVSVGANWVAEVGLPVQSITAATSAVLNDSNVVNSEAVGFNELKTLLEDTIKTAVAGDLAVLTQNAQGYLVLSTVGTGATKSLFIDASSTDALLAKLGWTENVLYQGSATAAVGTLVVYSGYRGEKAPGTYGNRLKIVIEHNPKFISKGAGSDLAVAALVGDTTLSLTSASGLKKGSQIKITDGINTEYRTVTSVYSVASAAGVTHTVEFSTGLTNGYLIAGTSVNSLEFDLSVLLDDAEAEPAWKQLSMNSEAENYVGAVVNDRFFGSNYIFVEDQGVGIGAGFPTESVTTDALTGGTSELIGFANADIIGSSAAKTGLHALDSIECNLIAAPRSHGDTANIPASAAVQASILAYAESRMDCFALLDSPMGHSPAQVASYRADVLGVDSRWGALYYPDLVVLDPISAGANATVTIPPCGHLMGLYARVDALPTPNGGVAQSPAGEGKFGKLSGVKKLAYEVTDADQDTLNPLGVNCIRAFQKEILAWGARTLDSDPKWRYINVRRTMTYIQQSIRKGTRWAVFRNNDSRLWSKLETLIETFLSEMHKNGQLAGDKASDAYFVRIDSSTTTAADIENGRLNGVVGVALQRPAEFLIFTFGQYDGGSEIAE